jgi:hypothetical protein
VTTPLGTHTGWNPRDPATGAPEQIMPMQGFTRWFALTRDERAAAGDPRPSIEERYAGLDDYLAQVRVDAKALAAQRFILPEDIETLVADAKERWHYAASRGAATTAARSQQVG